MNKAKLTEPMKKKLDLRQALDVCFIVFEKNCGKDALLRFQKDIFMEEVSAEAFSDEWYAFVFAGIYYGFSQYAPAYMVLEYVRSIKYFLQETGYGEEKITAFLDTQFQAYIQCIIEERIKDCPALFYQRLLGKKIQEVNQKSAVILSGAMAMFAANCLDIFEQYEYSLTDG